MQEEVENRAVTLVISATKLTARLLKAAILKYLASRKEKRLQKARAAPEKPTGKQTVKQLIGQNQGVSNIEITDSNIKSFERVARNDSFCADWCSNRHQHTGIRNCVFLQAACMIVKAFPEQHPKAVLLCNGVHWSITRCKITQGNTAVLQSIMINPASFHTGCKKQAHCHF
ncbi:MAG: PcfB family protein [Oscillospiraceae bacterium]